MSHITPPYADNYDSKGPDKLCMENVSSMEESIVDYREDRRIAGRLPIDPALPDTRGRELIQDLAVVRHGRGMAAAEVIR